MQDRSDSLSKTGKTFINNPLGIIGLFLVLVDGIAAMVIVTSDLEFSLNLILVIFVVLFPIIVLRSFYLLVTKHHNKLYSPKDYKDEHNFVKTFDLSTNTIVTNEVNNDTNTKFKNNEEEFQIQSNIDSLEELTVIKETLTNIINIQEVLSKKVLKEDEIKSLEQEIHKNIDIDMEKVIKKRKSTSYSVHFSNFINVNEVVNKLIEDGYKASVYIPPRNNQLTVATEDEHEAIWLGYRIPHQMAVSVIREAKKSLPHLKYIQISSDEALEAPDYVHSQIFIGGSTRTAVDRFMLRELSSDDFLELFKTKNKLELHKLIRSFYN